MKKLLSTLFIAIMAVLFSACGQDPLIEIEAQVAKEKNPNRRELFSEFAQIFRRERAGQPFDATRGLALAVVFDYPEFVEFFIKHGGNVNGICVDGCTMLGFASGGHFLEVCQLLVKHGADVNLRSKEGSTPMMLALKNTNYWTTSSARRLSGVAEDDSERNRWKIVEFLFEKGADVNMKANDGSTSLLLAVAKQDEKMAAWLIQKGADVRAAWNDAVSPVHLAVSKEAKSFAILEMLLENGANPNAGADCGFENTALKMALDESAGKDFSYAECLLKHGADINTPTLLNFYVETQNLTVVKFLLTHGANPNSETVSYAARSGNLELVKLLVQAGATPPKGIEVVQIPGRNYAFGKYEVTQAQYKAVMGENPACFKGDNLPVEQVSWNGAVEFCKKLTERERLLGRVSQKQKYRLPSSEEWGHACKAGTTTKYYMGDSESDLARAGWYCGNSGDKTQPVGLKEANVFGLYDMHGNVWEWTSTPNGSNRVRRGGGWDDGADDCESSNWYSSSPERRRNNLGFRVVLSEAQGN